MKLLAVKRQIIKDSNKTNIIMATKTVLSDKFSIKLRDFVRGALLAVGVPILLVIQQSLDAGKWDFDWKAISMTAISTFIGYILKNWLFEPAKVITTVTGATDANSISETVNKAV